MYVAIAKFGWTFTRGVLQFDAQFEIITFEEVKAA